MSVSSLSVNNGKKSKLRIFHRQHQKFAGPLKSTGSRLQRRFPGQRRGRGTESAAATDVSCVPMSAHTDVPAQLALNLVIALQDAANDWKPTPLVESLQILFAGRHSMPKADSERNDATKTERPQPGIFCPTVSENAVGPDTLAVDIVKALRDATDESMPTLSGKVSTQRWIDWITCETVPRWRRRMDLQVTCMVPMFRCRPTPVCLSSSQHFSEVVARCC